MILLLSLMLQVASASNGGNTSGGIVQPQRQTLGGNTSGGFTRKTKEELNAHPQKDNTQGGLTPEQQDCLVEELKNTAKRLEEQLNTEDYLRSNSSFEAMGVKKTTDLKETLTKMVNGVPVNMSEDFDPVIFLLLSPEERADYLYRTLLGNAYHNGRVGEVKGDH